MKKSLFIIALFFGIIIQTNSLFASHYAGADLTYTCLGGGTYQITLTFYKDCSGIAPPANAAIVFSCTSNGNLNFNINLNQIPNTGAEITPACTQVPTSCSFNSGNNSSGHPYGIKEVVYQGNVTLAPCADWNMYWASGARNPISTLAITSNWYIPAQLNNSAAFGNSAPVYNNKMVIVTAMNNLTLLDYGATDPDGDSLSYSLYAPYTNGPSPLTSVIYNGGYSGNNFLSSSTPISINSTTGVISCTPDLSLTTAFGVRIDQWRSINGTMTMIGSNYRDLTLNVVSSGNHTPTLSGMDFTNSHTYNINDTIFSKSFPTNNLIEFDINGFDSDTLNPGIGGNAEKFNIAWDNGIPSAIFTIHNNGTDSAYAHFSMAPSNNEIGNHSFKVIIQDLACSYYAESSRIFNISIIDVNNVELNLNDTSICDDNSVTLMASTYINNPIYVWKRNGLIINTPQNTNTLVYNGANYTPQIDTITICIQDTNSTNCLATDTALIELIYQPNISISDTGFCAGSSIILDAGEGEQYLWKNEAGDTIGNIRNMEINQIGTFSIYVNGRTNSPCFDTDTFTVGVFIEPSVDLGPHVYMEYSDSLILDAGSTSYDYLWSTTDTTPVIKIYGMQMTDDSNYVWVDVINEYCVVRDSIEIIMLMNIEELNNNAHFNISPNPNNGIFYLNINDYKSGLINFHIYNSVGKEVLQKTINTTGNESIKVNTYNLAKGAYYFVIDSKNSAIWKSTIIIQ